jgi:hypothetical protein
MKKAESLNSGLFQKFGGDRINNLALCMGGQRMTTYDKNTCQAVDCADTGSSDGHTIGNERCDWYTTPC